MSDKADIFFGCLMAIYAFGGGWFLAYCTRDWRLRRRARIDVAPSPTMRFCRDCRWALPRPSGFWGTRRDFTMAKCMHPSSVRDSGNFLASGQYSPDNQQYCSVVRSRIGYANELCGETGMHWELRNNHVAKQLPTGGVK